ncbi:MAG: glycerophosphoryl diester phosphodiesterase membrane domain-containing protein [Salinibacterium sp.]|nr:glycerophosphoryl diester phosphodiesterase membrane domain-containing protein [Salinibacterium sp.]
MPGGQPGWTPPPRPGLIPLRPLAFGTLLGASFQVLRRNPRPTFGFSLLVTGVIYIVTLTLVGFVTFFAISRTQFVTNQDDADAIFAGSVGMILLSAIIPIGLSIVGSAILQGIISMDVARATLGEKLRLPGLWRAARGRIGALIGWSGIVSFVVVIAVLLLAVIVGLLIAFGGVAGVVIGVLLGLLFGAGALAVAAWLSTKLALVPSILMLERLTLRNAIARSWSLTGGFFWRTFGTLLLIAVIIQVASGIVSTPLQFIVGFGSTLLDPNNSQSGALVAIGIVYVLTVIFTVVFASIGAVVQAAAPALIYIDIRMRKEGLDLELGRFVEARQAGDDSIQDPYLVKATSAATAPAPSTSPWS